MVSMKLNSTYNAMRSLMRLISTDLRMEPVKAVTDVSYAYGVSAKTSMIGYYAKNEAQKSNTYSSSGKYTYNHNTGSVYSSET